MLNILIEGWIAYPHSYALVNVYQMLSLLKKPNVKLLFSEQPPFREEWKRLSDQEMLAIIDKDDLDALNAIERYNGKQDVDVIYRIVYPYDISRRVSNQDFDFKRRKTPLVIFYTSEFGLLKDNHFAQGTSSTSFIQACFDKRVYPVTPSQWSAQALRKNKFDPLVIPHGIDSNKYKILSNEERLAFRNEYDIPENAFVFLNVGAMTGNKNIKLVLKSFYRISMFRENVYLILKGIGDLYACNNNINLALRELTTEKIINKKQWKKVRSQVIFLDQLFSYVDMCRLYNASDCYLSPYIAEGFNLPVLEAAACGLPTIVSKGGPTDDFTTASFAKYPKTYICKTNEHENGKHDTILIVDEGSLQENMLSVIDDPQFRNDAKMKGSSHVQQHYTWDKVSDKLYNFLNYITPEIMPNMINNCHFDPMNMR